MLYSLTVFWNVSQTGIDIIMMLYDCAVIGWAPSHLGRLDFVSRAAAPTFKIRQHLTLLALHTRLHLTPPLLCYYRSCADREEDRKKRESQYSAHSVGTVKTAKKHAQITTHPRFWRMQQWRLRDAEHLRRSRSRPLSKEMKLCLYLFLPKTMRLVWEEVFVSKLKVWIHQSDVDSMLTVYLSG